MTARFLVADVYDGLATLEAGSVDLVVTSPPFLALRSYLPADHPDKDKEIGSEATPAAFIDVMLAVTAELRRVLAPHGSIAVELGDTYADSGGPGGDYSSGGWREGQPKWERPQKRHEGNKAVEAGAGGGGRPRPVGPGWPLAKSKALIPELYRIALAYGINPLTGAESPAGRWRVRNVVTWCRPNPPVGALGDKWRPATSDVVIACTSSKRYWDDVATRTQPKSGEPGAVLAASRSVMGYRGDPSAKSDQPQTVSHEAGAPLLDWWSITAGGYPGAHYAVFPSALVEPLVKAMAPPKVCRTCGEPSRRIVETTYDSNDPAAWGGRAGWSGERPSAESQRTNAGSVKASQSGVNPSAQGMAHGRASRIDSTVGWTDCGHGEGCRPTTWKTVEMEVVQGRVKGGKWTDLDEWDWSAEPDEMRMKVKRKRVIDDLGECHDESHWRPALVLDPFAGSGTTLSVATGHGHDALGIDLDSRNRDLAYDRIGPFLFEDVAT